MSELYSSIGCMDVNLSFDAHKITKSAPGFSIPMTLAPSRTLNLAKTFAQSSVLSVPPLSITLSTEISVIQFQIIYSCTSTVALPLWQVTCTLQLSRLIVVSKTTKNY